ncbi:hypothetical protein EDC19_2409 [Natranaerovirga hydrolytica]|uniref:Uncharacterized protein n=1 Tax=Natranaerovirga hydrolytica TaxID=680378 RepID=A0A4R1MFW8_9FIRM|nr:flagellar biosynthesis protein FlgA [Natranaerovirga hydrolytica]TCK90640.1 hypothetical protein EDC19_2409 [Natranaerovirga hydrolytica]
MDLKNVKNVSPNKNFVKKILSLTLSIIIIIISFVIISNANEAAQNTIDVIRIRSRDGIGGFLPITENDIEIYSLIKKEYNSDMILAEEKDNVLNQYTKYYIRQNTILHNDQITDEIPKKNEWLYELNEAYEILTIPYNHLESGGSILLPGDAIRIRVSYEVDEDTVTDNNSYNPNVSSVQNRRGVTTTEILFNEIIVMDMLNTDSHSIYEIYKEVMKLSEDKRQEAMKSEEFMRSIQPRSLVLAGTKEQINNYAKYLSYDSQAFLITILSRENREIILDQLPTLEREVESWLEK